MITLAPRLNRPARFAAHNPRHGFTLLEMILALAIGIVLMYSLYSVLNLQVQQAQGGRLTLQEGTLARSILTRMTRDILGNLGPVNTFVQPDPNAASSSGATGTDTTTPTTTETNSTITFNRGMYGTSNVLILTVSQVPQPLSGRANADPTQEAMVCDLRRISYWLVNNGSQSGLARQEVLQPTSADLDTTPPDVPDANSYIIAPEVKDITFRYWDGASWQDEWDGTTLGGPLVDTPIGPPSAVEVTITFNRRGADNTDVAEGQLPTYSQVVAIPAGNNFPQTNP